MESQSRTGCTNFMASTSLTLVKFVEIKRTRWVFILNIWKGRFLSVSFKISQITETIEFSILGGVHIAPRMALGILFFNSKEDLSFFCRLFVLFTQRHLFEIDSHGECSVVQILLFIRWILTSANLGYRHMIQCSIIKKDKEGSTWFF